MNERVYRVRTSLRLPELRTALLDGHVQLCGHEPSSERLTMALAQLAHEHARGEAIWNYNLGNVDASADWQGDRFELTAREVIDGREVLRTKRLRAYASPVDGAAGYWQLLASRYPDALAQFDAGDATGAAAALKTGGWFTGSLHDYAREMRLFYLEFFDSPALADEVYE